MGHLYTCRSRINVTLTRKQHRTLSLGNYNSPNLTSILIYAHHYRRRDSECKSLLKILFMDSKNDLASFQLQLHEIRHFLHKNEFTLFYSADSQFHLLLKQSKREEDLQDMSVYLDAQRFGPWRRVMGRIFLYLINTLQKITLEQSLS